MQRRRCSSKFKSRRTGSRTTVRQRKLDNIPQTKESHFVPAFAANAGPAKIVVLVSKQFSIMTRLSCHVMSCLVTSRKKYFSLSQRFPSLTTCLIVRATWPRMVTTPACFGYKSGTRTQDLGWGDWFLTTEPIDKCKQRGFYRIGSDPLASV
jgi:hypothetical protein